MKVIKNTATNCAELYKLLGQGNRVEYKNFFPNPSIDKLSLLTNPAGDSVVLYTRDGSDYSVYISEIKNLIQE
jgi:hypothetical protein